MSIQAVCRDANMVKCIWCFW